MNRILILLAGVILMSLNFSSDNLGIWKTLHDDNSVKIESSVQNCDDVKNGTDNNYNTFKFTNKTDKKVKVSFQYKIWSGGTCSGCEESGSAEKIKSVELEPNSVKETSCSDRSLNIFHSSKSGTIKPIERFEIYNVKTENI